MIVITGTISAQPNENMPISGSAHSGCGANSRLATTLTTDTAPMTTNPWRICRRGAIRPASRPLAQAPPMIPAMLQQKNQKNCVGASWSTLPRKAGADSTYRNMPLNGTPLASASSRKRRCPSSSA